MPLRLHVREPTHLDFVPTGFVGLVASQRASGEISPFVSLAVECNSIVVARVAPMAMRPRSKGAPEGVVKTSCVPSGQNDYGPWLCVRLLSRSMVPDPQG